MLLGLRENIIASGLARSTVNDRVGIIRRAFEWAAEQERIPPSVYHGLLTVRGLRRGRGGARETEPVRPAIDIAWKAQNRLRTRYLRMRARGKAQNATIVAMAREFLGFVWAIRQEVDKRAA